MTKMPCFNEHKRKDLDKGIEKLQFVIDLIEDLNRDELLDRNDYQRKFSLIQLQEVFESLK